MKKIKTILTNLQRNSFINKIMKPIYLYITDKCYRPKDNEKNRKFVLISYLTEPFRRINDIDYLNSHQNKRETLLIDYVLKDFQLNREYIRFDSPKMINRKYDIVFGLEPLFVRAAKKNPNAIKIYYATGAYWMHQNSMISSRTKDFNKKHNCHVKLSRIVEPHIAPEIADYIIQIGSKYTIDTYPESCRRKIITIRQTCHNFSFDNFLERKINHVKSNEFIWMGSKGSILKGLDLVLEYFFLNPDKKLHIIGPVDPDVFEVYERRLSTTYNIKLHGFLDMDSKKLERIALNSAFVIMPSASEGCPGAVINMMKLGCIPLVSKYAAFDNIEEYGYLINDFTDKAIRDTIELTNHISKGDLIKNIQEVSIFANSNFNAEVFIHDMKKAFSFILSTEANKRNRQ